MQRDAHVVLCNVTKLTQIFPFIFFSNDVSI